MGRKGLVGCKAAWQVEEGKRCDGRRRKGKTAGEKGRSGGMMKEE